MLNQKVEVKDMNLAKKEDLIRIKASGKVKDF